MDAAPTSIPELIDRWKTIRAFAVDIGCGYEAARQMRRRGTIAPDHWRRVVDACRERGVAGVTFEWLAQHRANEIALGRPVNDGPAQRVTA
jgi:hypothetical protein